MFGDFWQQFGLNFPFFGQVDQQGGMFAQYASPNPTAHEPGTMGQAPLPPSPQNAPAASPRPPEGPSALASPLEPGQQSSMKMASRWQVKDGKMVPSTGIPDAPVQTPFDNPPPRPPVKMSEGSRWQVKNGKLVPSSGIPDAPVRSPYDNPSPRRELPITDAAPSDFL